MACATSFSVLNEFLTSFLLFLFIIFALLYVSELGFLKSGVEQASFFAARSELVGLRGSYSGYWMARLALDPTFQREGQEVQMSLSQKETITGAHLDLPLSMTFPLLPKATRTISGFTAIPSRSLQ